MQEFIGYCLIPSNKGQRMMVIKGNDGEGKSQIGVVLSRLFGCCLLYTSAVARHFVGHSIQCKPRKNQLLP